MGLFQKNKNNDEKTNLKCDICGNTIKDTINHKDKKACNECYLEIVSESKDTE